jgi:hypothetical protein
MIEFLVTLQTLILLVGVGFYLYKNREKKAAPPIVIVENLPKDMCKGFGYVKDQCVVLNEERVPYLYETYGEAKKNMKKMEGVDGIVYQRWDLDTQTVFIGEVHHGAN